MGKVDIRDLVSVSKSGEEGLKLYLHFPIRLYARVLEHRDKRTYKITEGLLIYCDVRGFVITGNSIIQCGVQQCRYINQICAAFHTVRAALAKFGLQADSMKFNTQTEE